MTMGVMKKTTSTITPKAVWYALGIAVFCVTVWHILSRDWLLGSSIQSLSSSTTNKENDAAVPSCQKYIVLTTSRSGSTWMCSVLKQQDGIQCGGRNAYGASNKQKVGTELMLFVQSMNQDITWEEYERQLLHAINESMIYNEECTDKPRIPAAAGFNLHYEHLPARFLEKGQFQQFLREHQIAVVHLVREAKILKLASQFSRYGQNETFNTSNEEEAAKYRLEAKKLTWDKWTIQRVLDMERHSSYFGSAIELEHPPIPYHYVSYEKLLPQEEVTDRFLQVVSFLLPTTTQKSIRQEPGRTSIRMHALACSDRVENYEKFRYHPDIVKTRTARACDYLAKIASD